MTRRFGTARRPSIWRPLAWVVLGGAASVGLVGVAGIPDVLQGTPPPGRVAHSEIEVRGLDGRPTRLPLARGRASLVAVWATWCGPCREEIPALVALSDSLDPRCADVHLVSVEHDTHQVREWMVNRGLAHEAWLDPGGEITRERFGAAVLPYALIFDGDGRIAGSVAGATDWRDAHWVVRLHGLSRWSGNCVSTPRIERTASRAP